MIKRIELLVHAGAPSGRKDDDRHKAQARAYSQFEAGNITRLSSVTPEPPPEASQPSSVRGDGQDETAIIYSPTTFLDDTQLAITGLESQLLTSSLPIPSGRVAHHHGSESSQASPTRSVPQSDRPSTASSEAPVTRESLLHQIRSFGKRRREDGSDEVSQRVEGALKLKPTRVTTVDGSCDRREASSEAPSLSSYLKTPLLVRTVKKRRVDGEGWKASHGTRQPYVTVPDSSDKGIAYVGERSAPPATAPAAVARSQDSLAGSEPTSELPTSYSLSDITSESSRARPGISQRSASAPGSIRKAAPSSSANADASTESGSSLNHTSNGKAEPAPSATNAPAQVQRKPEIVVIDDDTQEKARVTNVPAPKTVTKGPVVVPQPSNALAPAVKDLPPKPADSPSTKLLETLRSLPTSIYPPEPPISLDTDSTNVTSALGNLATNSDVRDRYKPFSTTRTLRPLERGYWVMDTSSWPLKVQVEFWQFMVQVAANGSAGWGVWCTRDCDEDAGKGKSEGLGMVRVYCWGEVVQHVYLLLYVASKSQARKLGMCWVDGEGEVVIRMKGP